MNPPEPELAAPWRPERFPPGVAERLGYYVYALRDPLAAREIFYVGKGIGERVHQHANRAARVDGESASGLRLDRIRAIHAAGKEVGVEIIRHSLIDEKVAFAVESAVIDALRLNGNDLRANLVSGHGGGDGYGQNWEPLDDIVATYAARSVQIPVEMNIILIRLNRARWLAEGDLLEKTRKWWRLGERRTRAEWAFAVHDGIVRAAFRIDGWERPSAEDLRDNPQRHGRWAFIGEIDPDVTERFRYADVRSRLGKAGSQNPVRYVNCR